MVLSKSKMVPDVDVSSAVKADLSVTSLVHSSSVDVTSESLPIPKTLSLF